MPAQGVPISTGTCWRERRANMIALFAGTLPVADVTFFHFRLSSTALSKVGPSIYLADVLKVRGDS